MLEALFEATALPNLHPAVVHFPIALAAVALLFDLVAFTGWRSGRSTALTLWWLAAAAGLAAYLSGREAADGLGMIAPEVERAVGAHSDWAWWTWLGLAGVAFVRAVVATGWGGRPALALVVLAGAGVQLPLLRTADLGGALVYRHGVGVAAVSGDGEVAEPAPARPASTPPSPFEREPDPERDLERAEDGSWTWTPRPGDASVVGRIVELSERADLEVEILSAEGAGLVLRVAGDGALLLPGLFRGLRVEVDLDARAFRGTLGPAMLAPADGTGLALEWTDPGRVALVRLSPDEKKQASAANADLPAGRLRLALQASEGHWKGFADEENLVHAHGKLADELRPAIVLRGHGELTLLRVRATPL